MYKYSLAENGLNATLYILSLTEKGLNNNDFVQIVSEREGVRFLIFSGREGVKKRKAARLGV